MCGGEREGKYESVTMFGYAYCKGDYFLDNTFPPAILVALDHPTVELVSVMRQTNLSFWIWGHRLHLGGEYSLASESIQLTIVQSSLSSPRLDSRVNGLSG